MRKTFACIALLVGCSSSLVHAENWGHWRGAYRERINTRRVLHRPEWSTTKNMKWKVAIPGRRFVISSYLGQSGLYHVRCFSQGRQFRESRFSTFLL